MFATSGYFKGVNCAYFASGLCERPYCHFRHVKSDSVNSLTHDGAHTSMPPSHPEALASDGQEKKSSLLSMVGNAIKQVQQDIEMDSVGLGTMHAPAVGRHQLPQQGGLPRAIPAYRPTPISQINKDRQAVARIASQPPTLPARKYAPASAPVYKPTPIQKLKQKPKPPGVEYDPVANFSTKGPAKRPVERVTLGDVQQEPAVKSSQTPESNVGKTAQEPEAKFSDEEEEEDNLAKDRHKEEKAAPENELAKGDDVQTKTDSRDKNEKELERVATECDSSQNTKRKAKETDVIVVDEPKRDIDIENGAQGNSISENPADTKSAAEPDIVSSDVAENSVVPVSSVEVNGQDTKEKTEESVVTVVDELKPKENDAEKESHSGNSKDKASEKENKKHSHKKHHHKHKDEHDSKKRSSRKRSRSSRSTSSERHSQKKRKKHISSGSSSSSSGSSSDYSSSRSSSSSSSSPRRNKRRHSSSSSHKKKHKQSSRKSRSHDKHKHSSRHRKQSSHKKDKRRDKSGSSHRKHSSSKSSSSSSKKKHKRRHSSAKRRNSDMSPHRLHRAQLMANHPSRSRGDSEKSSKDADSKGNNGTKAKTGNDDNKSKSSRSSTNIKVEPSSLASEVAGGNIGKSDAAENHTGTARQASLTSQKPSLSPPSANIFEKFQTQRSVADLFGEDSDEDRKSAKIAQIGDLGPKVKRSDKRESDSDVISLSSLSEAGGDAPCVDLAYDSDYLDTLNDSDKHISDEDAYDECLKIYKDYAARPREVAAPEKTKNANIAAPEVVDDVGKKRVAHSGANDQGVVRKKPKVGSRLTPAQVMLNRQIELKKRLQKENGTSSENNIDTSAAPSAGKPRVAHMPKSTPSVATKKTSLKAKPLPLGAATAAATKKTEATPCGTTKCAKRVAHVPSKKILKRPTIPAEVGGKVPINIRQRYLNLMIDECLKLYPEEKDAHERALTEEKAAYQRANNKNIYLNVAVNTIKKLRDEAGAASGPLSPSKNPRGLSHAAVLGGKAAANTSFTVNRSARVDKQPEQLRGAALYKRLASYVLTEDQLVDNGFPRPNPDRPGEVILKVKDKKKKTSQSATNERLCCRCGTRFVIFPNGNYAREDSCVYHWGRSFKRRVAGSIESRFTCCDGDMGAKGCQLAKYHVNEDNRQEDVKGFMKTMPRSPPPDGNYKVFALDCEMVYTVAGSELARITVIDEDLKSVYESFVKPDTMVVDHNSRFSGLTADDLRGVTTSIRDVQAVLLSMFSDKTILIGHSLESDFVALKLIHNTVVDTSVVFPHRMGPPYKRALRTLSAEILQKIIQNSLGGHDSQEDAATCLELMFWKVKEDAKKEYRRI